MHDLLLIELSDVEYCRDS